MTTLDEFMSDGNYLPDFMRDFHDAKLVFKRIDEMVQRSRALNIERGESLPDMGLINWIDAQCYVVDFFLWYMAKRGYTLQKSRKYVDFIDIKRDLSEFEERMNKAKIESMMTEINRSLPPDVT